MQTEQQTLYDELTSLNRLEMKFLKFHDQNPEVYTELVKLARQAKKVGRSKMGMKALWEVMRWEHMMQTKDTSSYKLNNDYTSRYARLIMKKEPDLDKFFETRKLKTE